MEQPKYFLQTEPEPHLYDNFFENLSNAPQIPLNLMNPFIFAANYKGDPGMVDDPQFTLDVLAYGSKIETLYSEIISEDSNAAMVLSLINHNLAWFNSHDIVPALGPGSGTDDATLLLAADPKVFSFVAHVPNSDPDTAPDEDSIEYWPSTKRLENPFITYTQDEYLMKALMQAFKVLDERLYKKGKIFYMSKFLFDLILASFPSEIVFYKAFEGYEIPTLFKVPIKVELSWDLWAARLGISPYMALLTIPQNITTDGPSQNFLTKTYSYTSTSKTLEQKTEEDTKTFDLVDPEAAIFLH